VLDPGNHRLLDLESNFIDNHGLQVRPTNRTEERRLHSLSSGNDSQSGKSVLEPQYHRSLDPGSNFSDSQGLAGGSALAGAFFFFFRVAVLGFAIIFINSNRARTLSPGLGYRSASLQVNVPGSDSRLRLT
jgi:hypothetical protein